MPLITLQSRLRHTFDIINQSKTKIETELAYLACGKINILQIKNSVQCGTNVLYLLNIEVQVKYRYLEIS